MPSIPAYTSSAYVYDATFVTAFDYDGSGNVVYAGRAVPGTTKASALWQIQKFTYGANGVTDIQFASGSDRFSFVWDNRASYTYS